MVLLREGGKWIRSADVTTGETITIKDWGEWRESTQFKYKDGNPKMDFVIMVSHSGEEKQMRLNATNRDVLKKAYGKDTNKWLGKSATIEKMKALIGGKQMDVIILSADEVVRDVNEPPIPEEPPTPSKPEDFNF